MQHTAIEQLADICDSCGDVAHSPATSYAAGVGPSMTGEAIAEEEEEVDMTPDQLEMHIGTLLDSCTYTIFNYTRRGLFDKDKLIVLTLLTFQILLREGKVDVAEYEALCKGARSTAPLPITDDLSRWMIEGQWAAVDALAGVPGGLQQTVQLSSWGNKYAMMTEQHQELPTKHIEKYP